MQGEVFGALFIHQLFVSHKNRGVILHGLSGNGMLLQWLFPSRPILLFSIAHEQPLPTVTILSFSVADIPLVTPPICNKSVISRSSILNTLWLICAGRIRRLFNIHY